jgi:hypothetical protein
LRWFAFIWFCFFFSMRTDTNFWLFSVPFVINPLLIIASLFLLSPCCLFAHVYHFMLITISRSSPFLSISSFLSFITVPFVHHCSFRSSPFFHSPPYFSFITVLFIHHHFFHSSSFLFVHYHYRFLRS